MTRKTYKLADEIADQEAGSPTANVAFLDWYKKECHRQNPEDLTLDALRAALTMYKGFVGGYGAGRGTK